MNSEARNKTLYYFTRTYPYGHSPLWKKNELEVLRHHFGRVIVIPLMYGSDNEARNIVEGIEYLDPITDAEHSRTDRTFTDKVRIFARLLRSHLWPHFFRELFTAKVLSSTRRLKEMLRATYEIGLFFGNTTLCNLLENIEKDSSTFYFYWGIGQVNALLLTRSTDLPYSACRFHGWDLYEERHETRYIPYRGQIVKVLDLLLPCSDHGARYLKTKYGSIDSKVVTARLGTMSLGRSNAECDEVLKLVSCSNVVSVKRLDLLCEALMRSSIPVHWTHFGDGELMSEIRSYVERFPSNVSADLRGAIPGSQVPKALADGSFDLFVNTSSSEGVPVSIMEAFAAGIPVLATDVGGTGEIVDGTVGKLVPSSVSADELAGFFEEFHFCDGVSMSRLRDNAFDRFREMCDARVNAEKLAQVLATHPQAEA